MIEYKHYDRSYEDEVLKVFTESFKEESLKYNEKSIGNWTFKMEL